MDQIASKEKIEVVLRQETQMDESSISLRDIIEVILKGKILIAVIVIASLLLTYIGVNFASPYTGKAKMLISFNFDGIDKGLDPYGKKFDVSKIKAPVVLDEVVKSMELDKLKVSTEDLKRNIDITPIIPGDVIEKIKSIENAKKQNIQDVQDYTYYPNEYEITFNISKSLKIDNKKGQDILGEVIKAYETYFYKNYSDRDVLANALGELNYDSYDYPEVSRVMHNQINIVQNYLTAKSKEQEASDFRSKQTGLSFNDINESVAIINKVDLSRMDSIIGAFNLTKDKEKLLKLYEYMIKQDELTSAKKNDESNIASNMLGKFQKDKNTLILSGLTGSNSLDNSLQTEQNSKYYDDLAARATDAGVDAKDAMHDADYYKKEIEKLQNDTVSADMKKSAEKDVLDMITSIKGKLDKWIKLTNNTVAEYYEVNLYNNAIKRLSPVEVYPGVEKKSMILAISLVIGLMLGLFVAFIREYWKKSRLKEDKSITN